MCLTSGCAYFQVKKNRSDQEMLVIIFCHDCHNDARKALSIAKLGTDAETYHIYFSRNCQMSLLKACSVGRVYLLQICKMSWLLTIKQSQSASVV